MSGRITTLAYAVVLAIAICCIGGISTWTAEQFAAVSHHIGRPR